MSSKYTGGLPSALQSKGSSPTYEDGAQFGKVGKFQKSGSLHSSNEKRLLQDMENIPSPSDGLKFDKATPSDQKLLQQLNDMSSPSPDGAFAQPFDLNQVQKITQGTLNEEMDLPEQ